MFKTISSFWNFLVLVFVFSACTPEELPPFNYNELETLEVDRPESASIVCRFKTYAPTDTVWKFIATSKGLEMWAADSAFVELKGGGEYTLVSKNGTRDKHVIRSIVMGKKISYNGDTKGTWESWQIESLHQGGSRVTYVSSGISPEWREQWKTLKEPTASFVKELVVNLSRFSPK